VNFSIPTAASAFEVREAGVNKRVAIAGIGTTGFGRFTDRSATSIANEALSAALDDAGLGRGDVDGIITQIGSPRGLDCDELARMLALDVRYASETWDHGRFCATVVGTGAMALMNSLAETIVCIAVFRNSAFARHGAEGFPGFAENFREGGGPHAETPHCGLLAPIGGAAMSARRYMHKHNVAPDGLAAIALAFREHAALNPYAAKRERLTREEYLAAPFICEPLRRLDCSVPIDTASVIIMTRSERAKTLRQPPVFIESFQGLAGGPNEFVFGQPGLGINQRDVFDYAPLGAGEPVFANVGITPTDVDTLHTYDGFAPQVLWTLERFGFAAPGKAADWVQGGRIALGGELPINTSGGHLSEGHSNGWGQTLEIVRQLRDAAGDRQIPNCRRALWATTFGDAILYAN
jgi:acetyl-CoA acetyltransferase